jgi:small subunit ribosomal protein S18
MPPENNRNRRKICNFCVDNIKNIDFTDANKMRRYLTERGKVLPRRITGTCAKHQRLLAVRVKTSRQAGLIPYVIAG